MKGACSEDLYTLAYQSQAAAAYSDRHDLRGQVEVIPEVLDALDGKVPV